MKKRIVSLMILLMVVITLASCASSKSCPAYGGEKSQYQKNYK